MFPMRGAFLSWEREEERTGNKVCNEDETHSTACHWVRWPLEVLWKFGFYGGSAAQLQSNCFSMPSHWQRGTSRHLNPLKRISLLLTGLPEANLKMRKRRTEMELEGKCGNNHAHHGSNKKLKAFSQSRELSNIIIALRQICVMRWIFRHLKRRLILVEQRKL